MKKFSVLTGVLAGAFVVVLMMLLGATGIVLAGQQAQLVSSQCQVNTTPIDPGDARNTTWNAEQKANAAAIVAQVKVDVAAKDQTRAAVVALATAMQESSLTNVAHGDAAGQDSRGLFQQRAPWGPLAQRMDPRGATHLFLTVDKGPGVRGLIRMDGKNGRPGPWQQMPITVAAQTVQSSAFPTAYAKWEGQANALARALLGTPEGQEPIDPCGGLGGAAGSVPVAPAEIQAMLAAAKTLVGTPYVYGGDGSGNPPRVDCSGLIVFAWRKVGKPLRIRVSEQMWSYSAELQPGTEQPGDLIFSEFGPNGPGHVMIVWDPVAGIALQAPHTGDVVKFSPYTAKGHRFGRLQPTAWAAPS